MSKKLSTAYLQSSSFEGNNVLALRFTSASSSAHHVFFQPHKYVHKFMISPISYLIHNSLSTHTSTYTDPILYPSWHNCQTDCYTVSHII